MMFLLNILAALILFTGSESNVDNQVDSFFKEALKDYDDYNVEMLRKPENLVSIKFETAFFPRDKALISLPAEVKYSDGRTGKSIISFRIKLYKKALFSTADISKDEDLKPENFELRSTEVNNINGTPVCSFEEIKKYVAKKRIKAGELILKEFVEKASVIKAGDNITASVVAGSTVISFDAVSKQDGKEDQVIRITGANKKQYKAKVIDSKNVRITE